MRVPTLLAIALLLIVATAGTLLFFVSVLPILIGVDLAAMLLCGLVLALATGRLQRWIEVVEEAPTPVRQHAPRTSLRLLVWPWA